MSTRTVEGFSISHAAILNGSTGAEEAWGDVYGIREGSIEIDSDTFDNTGDDAVLSTWFWFNYATVTVTAGYVSFELVQSLTGATLSSSGTSPNDYFNLPMWQERSFNTATRPMLIRCPSKDNAGAVRALDIVLYKVQFEPIAFDGPAYKDGLVVNYSGKALISSVNEAGVDLTSSGTIPGNKAVGRLISRPAP